MDKHTHVSKCRYSDEYVQRTVQEIGYGVVKQFITEQTNAHLNEHRSFLVHEAQEDESLVTHNGPCFVHFFKVYTHKVTNTTIIIFYCLTETVRKLIYSTNLWGS